MSDRIDEENLSLETTENEVPTKTSESYFGRANDVIQRYSHCVMCGGNLHFTHQTDFSRNLTQETAKCPECGVRVRSILHRLQ